MANGQYIIPGSLENDAIRRSVEEAYVNSPVNVSSPLNEIDHSTQQRVDEIIDHYPIQVVEQALDAARNRNTPDAFDQILIENPEMYGLIYDVAEGVSIDAELYRASAKPDVLKPSLKERAFGIFLEKPEFGIRLIDAESNLGGKMFGNEKSSTVNRRFWYFEGDWFFEQYEPSVGYQVMRYQIFKDSMHKLYNGREYPFNLGEKATLVKAVMNYGTDVLEPLYGKKPSKPALAA